MHPIKFFYKFESFHSWSFPCIRRRNDKKKQYGIFYTYRFDRQRPKLESLLKGREIRCWSSSSIVRATKIADTILYHQELAWKITRRLCLQGMLVWLHYMGVHWRSTEGRIFLYHILCNYNEALFQSNEAWHSTVGRALNKVNHITTTFCFENGILIYNFDIRH